MVTVVLLSTSLDFNENPQCGQAITVSEISFWHSGQLIKLII
jgi:hypothetical protein